MLRDNRRNDFIETESCFNQLIKGEFYGIINLKIYQSIMWFIEARKRNVANGSLYLPDD